MKASIARAKESIDKMTLGDKDLLSWNKMKECLEISDLKALAASHTRLLEAAKEMFPKLRFYDQTDEIAAAIEEAEERDE